MVNIIPVRYIVFMEQLVPKLSSVNDSINTTVLIPAYNEEATIGKLISAIIDNFPQYPIIIVDNNSTDATPDIVKQYDVELLYESKQGKGYAILRGLKAVKTDCFIMMDADFTYHPKYIPIFSRLVNGYSDVALGSRLSGLIDYRAMSKLTFFGNKVLSFLASILFRRPITDLCTGYWAFNRKAKNLLINRLDAKGFELEAKIFSIIAKNKLRILEIPINYYPREGSRASKLSPVTDGVRIFKTLIKKRFASNY